MQDFEKLGAFYLGKMFDMNAGELRDDLLLYDSKDLTTHAVCVGMTGSGKTGLCLSLLEEAAIDGIPAICVDPKGDIGNLLLSFPDLQPGDFEPWIDSGDATRKGCTVPEYAKQVADRWRKGLGEWGQDASRITRFRDATDLSIYTPGSNTGLPLTVLRSFTPPTAAVVGDADAFRECIMSAVSGLLALLNIDADPISSREHILLSNIFDHAWRAGKSLDMAALIREIQSPPFDKIGVMDLETIFSAKDRFGLAMQLNNLLGSPGFAAWMEGEPLDIQRLMYTQEGKPRMSIISIAHLSDTERMFFVTTLLNEVVGWMRSQPGTSSLRALFYMDEVFGYFPPTANPPSKRPMLTLLKQARAFGLGVVLATQNPVDLDYKGLSNAGTWFLGRLQTERDKARVLEGLEGASAQAGSTFNRAQMEATLAGLGNRVFMMNNVHDDAPVVFQTRWALSYLRGPLSREQISSLMAAKKQARVESGVPASESIASPEAPTQRPVLPPGIDEAFVAAQRVPRAGERLIYRPAVMGLGRVHFSKSTYDVDLWETVALMPVIGSDVPDDLWAEATPINYAELEFDSEPDPEAAFAELPSALSQPKQYSAWKTALKNHLYQNHTLILYESPLLKLKSQPGETEGDFRVRVKQAVSEQRDLEVEKLRKKFAPKLKSLEERIRKAEQAVEVQKSQVTQQTWSTAVNIGTSVLGALFGRKLTSATNVTRAATSMRSASKIAQERNDVARAQDNVETLQEQLVALEEEFTRESDLLRERFTEEALELNEVPITPRKSDLSVEQITLVWTPWILDAVGMAQPAFGE
ncbi:MAG: ATP-binding protein [Planctomycetaceae bacterium]|nr:ATP-binding protein [Planctomycetales bacterium]MCB9921948.1 ATP-binding protein [Planctomycetaceae bacterium]